MRNFALACTALLAVALPVSADLESGPQMGAPVSPFEVKDVTGSHAGEMHCYRCEYGNSPVVAIFTNEMNDKVVKACKELDAKIGEGKDLKGFVVYMSNDTDAACKKLKEIASEKGIKNLPLTTVKGLEGLDSYKINEKAGVTVVMWNSGKVAMSEAFEPGSFCEKCCKSSVAKFCKMQSKGAQAAN